jgi:hypothetical protein
MNTLLTSRGQAGNCGCLAAGDTLVHRRERQHRAGPRCCSGHGGHFLTVASTLVNYVGAVPTPGTIKGLHLVVADIEQARADLVGRGVEVGAIEDVGGGVKYARLTDPDGNTLTLQEMAWRTGDKF